MHSRDCKSAPRRSGGKKAKNIAKNMERRVEIGKNIVYNILRYAKVRQNSGKTEEFVQKEG